MPAGRRPPGPERLEIRLLGEFAVLRDGVPVPTGAFGGRLARRLTRVLASQPGRPVSRDALADILWPDDRPADPDANLAVLVHRARRAMGASAPLRTTPTGYLLATGAHCSVDTERFLRAVAEGRVGLAVGRPGPALRCLAGALAEWSGDPLPEDDDGDWARDHREAVRQAREQALTGAAEAALLLGDTSRAVDWAGRAAAEAPLDEPAARLLARARAAAGDPAGALAALDALRDRLAGELGVDPTPQTARLRVQVLRGHVPAPASRQVGPVPGPPFVGRDAELSALLGLVRRRGGGIAVVTGRAGSGKSRLLAELAALAGTPVVTARAFLPERGTPWGLARTLLRSAVAARPDVPVAPPARHRTVLAELLPELAGGEEAGDRSRLEPRTRRALLTEAALRLLGAATAGGAVVLVDDVQWADASSLHLLALVAHRLDGIALVLAVRAEEAGPGTPAADLVAGLEATGPVRALSLGPLAPAALAELVPSGALLDVLVAHTDRTPFAVAEVLTALEAEGRVAPGAGGRWFPRSGDVVPRAEQLAREGQRRSVLGRTRRQDDAGRAVLSVLALLGREAPIPLVAAAVGRPETEVAAALDRLLRAELVRPGSAGWAVGHDLVGEAVAEGLLPAERATLHTRLAAALAAGAAVPGERARHLLGAGDPASAAAALAADAAEQLTRHANEEAGHLAGRALALDPPGPLRAELLGVRAEARARTGDLGGARADLRAALGLPREGRQRALLLARLAMLNAGAQDLRHASELAELALVEAGSDQAARARALAVAAVVDMNLQRRSRAARRAEEARRLFADLGDGHGVADVLDVRAMAGFLDGGITAGVTRFAEVARLYTDLGDLLRVVTPRSTRAHALLFAGRPAEGLPDSDAAVGLARDLGAPEAEAYARWHRSELLTACGRVEEALEDAARALATAEHLAHRGWTATALRARGLALRASGRTPAAESAFRRSLAAAAGLPLFTCWAHAQLALVLIDQGRPAEAAGNVARALATGPPLGRYEARLAEVTLARARGDPAAGALTADAVRRARSGGHLMSARLLVAGQGPDRRP